MQLSLGDAPSVRFVGLYLPEARATTVQPLAASNTTNHPVHIKHPHIYEFPTRLWLSRGCFILGRTDYMELRTAGFFSVWGADLFLARAGELWRIHHQCHWFCSDCQCCMENHGTSSSGWWFQTWILFSISYIIWDVILPIDELIFFIIWLLHHQPV